ncbi:MAG: ACP S-malonyltransferase [Rubrobacteraceae bacterium]
MDFRRAVVFPGQGTAGGEISGEVERAVGGQVGDGEVPYQLSVFANSVGLFYELRESGVESDVVAGHSLGEYGAAHAAGSITLEDGVRLVAERDRLMNEASSKNSGGMVAVIGADPFEVSRVVEEVGGILVAANFNTPRQAVISGDPESLEAASEKIKGRKVKLEVAGAFHSPLMKEASEEMGVLLSAVEIGDPKVPMVSATDGALLTNADDVRLALKNQMLSPVRWVAVVEKFEKLGIEEVIEAGEGGTLIRMLRDFKDKKFDGKTVAEVIS